MGRPQRPFNCVFALGTGLILSRMAMCFNDVVHIYEIFLTTWLYLTPIIYPVDIVPEEHRWALSLNSMYYLLGTFRTPVHDGRLPEPVTLLVATVTATLTLAFG